MTEKELLLKLSDPAKEPDKVDKNKDQNKIEEDEERESDESDEQLRKQGLEIKDN